MNPRTTKRLVPELNANSVQHADRRLGEATLRRRGSTLHVEQHLMLLQVGRDEILGQSKSGTDPAVWRMSHLHYGPFPPL